MKLEQAQAIVRRWWRRRRDRSRSSSPTADGELVAAATMDGAAPDTRLNAQRKAYTAARSDAVSTRALAEKVGSKPPAELASFDPFFTFFLGGVAAFDGDRRVGAVGVSGLPGADDDALARKALADAGLEAR